MMMSLLLLLAAQDDAPSMIRKSVDTLISCQDSTGAWPYEGVYRVKGEIPVGYKVGGTATVGIALLSAAREEGPARQALDRGLTYILQHLGDRAANHHLATETAHHLVLSGLSEA